MEHGFAGTVDIVGKGAEGQKFIVDWKTRKTKPKVKVTSYDFQIHQIAAYAATYWGEDQVEQMQVHGANCYISSTEPGRFEVIKYFPKKYGMHGRYSGSLSNMEIPKGYDPRKTRLIVLITGEMQ